jgi:hypothetical protein
VYSFRISLFLLALAACSSDDGPAALPHCPTRGGTIGIDGGFDFCPFIRSAAAEPISAPVGTDVQISVVALDSDSPNLSFTWKADSGTIVDPKAANTVYRCTMPGQASLTVTVSDGICEDHQEIAVLCR